MPADISAGLLPSLSLPPGHPHILCGRLVLAGDQYQVGLTDCTEKPCGDRRSLWLQKGGHHGRAVVWRDQEI